MKSNKVKLNDKFNKNKNKKIKETKYISEEAKEIRNFVIILISIIVIVLIVYAVSKVFMKDEKNTTEDTVQEGKIDYDKVSVGMIFNRNYDEYYVAVYNEENNQAVLYSTIITNYVSEKDSLKVFFCDLGNYLNEKYYVGKDGTSNHNATKVDELGFKDLTLLKIKNGKIVKYIEDFDTFKEELS